MEKKNYEISFILSGRLTEEELKNEIEKIKNIFQKINAQLLKESEFNKINLAYSIKKETEAFFGYFWFEVEPEKLAELREQLAFEKNILRYLIVTPPPKFKKTPIQRPHHKEFEHSRTEIQPTIPIEANEERKEPDYQKLEEKFEEIQKLV